MRINSRYMNIDRMLNRTIRKRIFALVLISVLLAGCGKASDGNLQGSAGSGARDMAAADSHVDFQKLREENSDIFAWIYVPDTEIDYPVVQNSEGDDSFYKDHNVKKQVDPKGAIHIEAANLTDMCDFNEVLHGSSPDDGTMFSDLATFLARPFFEKHPYIYVYMDGNALIYYVFAAYVRNNSRLLQMYDFTYAKGCQDFLDEIYDSKSMNKIVRTGWENAVEVDNFIITLSTENRDDPLRQTVVVGCLVGDAAGKINRVMDYSDPDAE